MQTAFEYISAGVILCLILGLTGQFATNMVYDRVERIKQTTGLGVADKMIDFLLLSPGTPSNWGRLVDPPQNVGLALESAIKPYQLDRCKVRRLSNGTANYIPPHEVRDLLGLSPNYYTDLSIYPIYNITVEQLTDEKFLVSVANQWDVPVSTVTVTGTYTDIIHLNSTQITQFLYGDLDAPTETNTTDINGQCTLNFVGAGSKPTLIVMGSQLAVRSLTMWPTLSDDLVGVVESSMGSPVGFDTEIVYRSVEIDGMNYYCKLVLWWS